MKEGGFDTMSIAILPPEEQAQQVVKMPNIEEMLEDNARLRKELEDVQTLQESMKEEVLLEVKRLQRILTKYKRALFYVTDALLQEGGIASPTRPKETAPDAEKAP
jgi:hypothetical protein